MLQVESQQTQKNLEHKYRIFHICPCCTEDTKGMEMCSTCLNTWFLLGMCAKCGRCLLHCACEGNLLRKLQDAARDAGSSAKTG